MSEIIMTGRSMWRATSTSGMDDMPVYVVCGTNDVLTPVAHTRTLQQLLPNARTEILSRTGHMIQLERNEEVTDGIVRLAFPDPA